MARGSFETMETGQREEIEKTLKQKIKFQKELIIANNQLIILQQERLKTITETFNDSKEKMENAIFNSLN